MGKRISFVSLFTMTDFRTFLRAWAEARGRGEYRRISKELGVHTTLMSQIVSGRKCLTEEQATKLCLYMGLNALETDYFLKLVQLERAGTESLKSVYKRHLQEIRAQTSEIQSLLPTVKKMTEQDRAIFYSSWQYSYVRLLTSVPGGQSVPEVSSRVGLPITRVRNILSFLVSRGLCKEINGRFFRTEKNTHVESTSPLAVRHHQNWRSRSLHCLENLSPLDLAFTAPISLSKSDFSKIRDTLLTTISNISNVVEESKAEEMAYLGIDWIKI